MRMLVNTGRVRIGLCHVPAAMPIRGMDAYLLQSALLDRRTSVPVSMVLRVLAPLLRWL